REFFPFPPDSAWTQTVRWRIRAYRIDRLDEKVKRQNSLPVTQFGPWSSVYSSTNATYQGGAIKLLHTISDVVSNGQDSAPAHRLMPGFTFSGDQTIDGTSAELFRVYVFTDRECLNRVYTSAVVGGPAYAPRPFGPLALPTAPSAIPSARSSYLRDGSEPESRSFDSQSVAATEAVPAATPTTAV